MVKQMITVPIIAKADLERELNDNPVFPFSLTNQCPTLQVNEYRVTIQYQTSAGVWSVFFAVVPVDGEYYIILFAPHVCFRTYKLSAETHDYFDGQKKSLADLPAPFKEFIKSLLCLKE
ncbi:hypothetical protein KJ836_02545 [Patescibacteria group bacterium]|nr:hypothetical protein [Patescibacteria group bacterium]